MGIAKLHTFDSISAMQVLSYQIQNRHGNALPLTKATIHGIKILQHGREIEVPESDIQYSYAQRTIRIFIAPSYLKLHAGKLTVKIIYQYKNSNTVLIYKEHLHYEKIEYMKRKPKNSNKQRNSRKTRMEAIQAYLSGKDGFSHETNN